MAFKPQKPSPDFSKIDGHKVHKHAPTPKPEPKVPASGQLDSENIKRWKYVADKETLYLTFHDGNRTYKYAHVRPSLVRGLIDAESPTAYFRENILPLDEGEVKD